MLQALHIALLSRTCSYAPSALEREWFNGTIAGRICAVSQSASQINGVPGWLSYAAASAGPQPRTTPSINEARSISQFQCSDHHGASNTYIEPLTGFARHPRADMRHWSEQRIPLQKWRKRKVHNKAFCVQEEEDEAVEVVNIQDTSYIMFENHCNAANPPGRSLLFDLGCSVYDLSTLNHTSPPSLTRLMAAYANNCIHPEHVYAWEAQKYDPELWWRTVPVSLRSRLHFFNHKVPQEPSDDPSSFIALLKEAARPKDFVSVKLDIDNSAIEHSIIKAILEDPSVTRLVDELFFEYHFEFDDVDFGWVETGKGHTVDDALALMRRLRERGVRAHFWP